MRVWTIQEVALAARSVVLSEMVMLSWAQLVQTSLALDRSKTYGRIEMLVAKYMKNQLARSSSPASRDRCPVIFVPDSCSLSLLPSLGRCGNRSCKSRIGNKRCISYWVRTGGPRSERIDGNVSLVLHFRTKGPSLRLSRARANQGHRSGLWKIHRKSKQYTWTPYVTT
jgi:hypothetical protein